jgi:hypothetical protein
MHPTKAGTAAAMMLVASAIAGCGGGVTEVAPASSSAAAATPMTAARGAPGLTPATASSTSETSTEAFDMPAFGVVPTTRTALPPNADTCAPPNTGNVTFGAQVADPAAPQIVVVVPAGFLPSSGEGDIAATMQGPDDMSATVTITQTDLEPKAAFKKYADAVTANKEFSSLSVLPGDLCGYSGQKLMGSTADKPGDTVQFRDRIAHIWTNTKAYLVAVHLQGRGGTAAFDAAESALMADFGIRIP